MPTVMNLDQNKLTVALAKLKVRGEAWRANSVRGFAFWAGPLFWSAGYSG